MTPHEIIVMAKFETLVQEVTKISFDVLEISKTTTNPLIRKRIELSNALVDVIGVFTAPDYAYEKVVQDKGLTAEQWRAEHVALPLLVLSLALSDLVAADTPKEEEASNAHHLHVVPGGKENS